MVLLTQEDKTLCATVFLGAIILVVFLILLLQRRYHGPWGLPYFGIYLFLKKDYHLQFTEMARKKYGDVFLFKITGKMYVHLGSLEAMREVHVKKAEHFPRRIQNNVMLDLSFGKGIFHMEGERWRVLRKFFINVLRELAGKEALASRLDIARSKTLERLRDSKGEPIDLLSAVQDTFIETVAVMFIGESHKHLIFDILKEYTRIATGFTGRQFLIAGSLAKWYAVRFTYFKQMLAARKEMESIYYKIIRQKEAAIASGEIEDSIIDRFLKERKSLREKGDSKAETFEESLLVGTLNQIFADTCEGISIFVVVMLRELSSNQNVQKKMREEMLCELGDDLNVNPTLQDKVRLPYVNAALKELYRLATFISTFPTLESDRETTVCGVRVPAGCGVLDNFYAAHHDPKTFDEPDKFMPERYLTSNSPQHAVFGMGKRSCIGEFMATMVIYLYVTAVIRNFVIQPVKVNPNNIAVDESLNMKVRAVPVNSKIDM